MRNRNPKSKTSTLKTLGLICLGTVSLSLASPAKDDGGASTGGGSTINGVTLDSYLADNKADASKLKAKVNAQLKALAEKSPEFAAELERAFKDLDWYMIDRPLEQLPFSKTKIPFAIKQIAIQIENNVFFEKEELNRLAEKKGEQEKMILHELVRRVFLQAEGTNVKIMESSVYKATDLIASAEKFPAKELNEKLESLGFQTKNIKYSKRKNEPKRELAAMLDPVSVQVNLKNSITIESAREVSLGCMASKEKKASLLDDVLRKLAGNPEEFTGIEYPSIPNGTPIINGPNPPGNWEHYQGFNTAEPRPDVVAPRAKINYGVYSSGSSKHGTSLNIQKSNSQIIFNEAGDWGTLKYVFPKISAKNVDEKILLELDGGFPSIEYSGIANEPVYTPMGLTNTQRHIESISIVANRNWVEGDGMVSLQNAVTGVTLPAEYKIDGKKYVNCLKDGFEKKSQQAQKKSSEQVDEALNAAVITSKASPKAKGSGDASNPSSSADKLDTSSAE